MKKVVALGIVAAMAGMGLMIFRQKPARDGGINTQKPIVAVSVYPVEFLVKTIVGNAAQVETIVPSGVEPHDFEPNPAQLKTVEAAGAAFVIGGSLETWSKSLAVDKLVVLGEKHMRKGDPHVWLDPLIMANMAVEVFEKLADLYPQNRAVFENNLGQLQKKLDDLDSKMRSGLKSCASRDMVVSHGAFGYLAERYGLTQVPISGTWDEDEPSPKELGETVNRIRRQGIKVVFGESLENQRWAETVAVETGVKVLPLSHLEWLSGEEVSRGADYISVMENNLASLRLGLACD